MKRYTIYKGSQSGHCCFNATVIDLTKPTVIGGVHYRDAITGQLEYEPLCECFTNEAAELICKALNLLDKTQFAS